jgi:hypothetical protein
MLAQFLLATVKSVKVKLRGKRVKYGATFGRTYVLWSGNNRVNQNDMFLVSKLRIIGLSKLCVVCCEIGGKCGFKIASC